MKRLSVTVVVALLFVLPLYAQDNLNNVHLFQSYFYDAPITQSIYGEGGLSFSTYDNFNSLGIGVQGGYPLNEKIELGTELRFLNWSPDKGDGQSGISDLGVYGRYNVYNKDQTNISAGALLSLPIGSEDVGQGNLNFGPFGAVRHTLNEQMVLVGTIGLFFFEKTEFEFNQNTFELEEKTSYDNTLNIGVGTIYTVNPQLNLVGELSLRSEGDYMLLSAGADYMLGKGRLRGALGLGLDDGAPDFMLMGGYSMALSK